MAEQRAADAYVQFWQLQCSSLSTRSIYRYSTPALLPMTLSHSLHPPPKDQQQDYFQHFASDQPASGLSTPNHFVNEFGATLLNNMAMGMGTPPDYNTALSSVEIQALKTFNHQPAPAIKPAFERLQKDTAAPQNAQTIDPRSFSRPQAPLSAYAFAPPMPLQRWDPPSPERNCSVISANDQGPTPPESAASCNPSPTLPVKLIDASQDHATHIPVRKMPVAKTKAKLKRNPLNSLRTRKRKADDMQNEPSPKLTSEEAQKREQLRSKNCAAAAKCRENKKRQHQQLVERSRLLEEENARLREDYTKVKQANINLKTIIIDHCARCSDRALHQLLSTWASEISIPEMRAPLERHARSSSSTSTSASMLGSPHSFSSTTLTPRSATFPSEIPGNRRATICISDLSRKENILD
ncbi:Transcription factor kayak [Neolecta irregularis DAH-3]|uniref:Transcription factor kayak n=1 Tax=Neolecta irregularis (strain DAH-3) TaxID=1198029 RepID=A0A1U7LHU6_NEOID|nr:Transcription factor kayak [Neolecta irregularis DAH-3]|eukprot:OLL22225.1 Transcription factor kayak [Neolecta irregularis DAH-3]